MEVAMAFREVRVYEVKEVLRLWLRGKGTRPIAALVGLDRKTVQRYIAAATGAGLQRDAGEDALGGWCESRGWGGPRGWC